ncbi:hypothetical protein [Paenibacillus sp. P22]|uniref:hypothetical protein n=1 Tax=Paenibacillus sp. P22 TaxID=483908 RepID=UPI0003FD01BA|nr:hypothetical protein [Paenibacillus sp. P22]CDN44016.1 hypothetical protein BN871_EA_00110 [Paenibacillus sp. P22]
MSIENLLADIYPAGEKTCRSCGCVNRAGQSFTYRIFDGDYCPDCNKELKRKEAAEKKAEIIAGDRDTECEDEITCPYCGHEFSDSFEHLNGWEEDLGNIECSDCNKTFRCTANFSVSYSTEKIEEEGEG